jgi:hypothetical protein
MTRSAPSGAARRADAAQRGDSPDTDALETLPEAPGRLPDG